MIEHGVEVKLVEKLSSVNEVWLLGVMLNNVLEALQEIVSGQYLCLSQDLTDDVLKFVVDKNNSVAVLSVIEDLISD